MVNNTCICMYVYIRCGKHAKKNTRKRESSRRLFLSAMKQSSREIISHDAFITGDYEGSLFPTLSIIHVASPHHIYIYMYVYISSREILDRIAPGRHKTVGDSQLS